MAHFQMALVGKSIQMVFDEEEAGGEPDIKGLNNFELIRLPFLSFCKLCLSALPL